MAGYYAGALVGALLAPKLIHRVGHTKVFAAVASIASGTALLFAIVPDAVFWFALRVMTGLCFAVIYIVAETWLNQSSTNEIRGKVMNFYVVLHYAGLGAGALMLNMGDPQGYELFILTSVLISFGIVPILLSAKPGPAFEAPKRLSVAALFRKAPLGVGAAVLCGLAMGALVGAGRDLCRQGWVQHGRGVNLHGLHVSWQSDLHVAGRHFRRFVTIGPRSLSQSLCWLHLPQFYWP